MHTRNLIGGEWVAAQGGKDFSVTNPANDAVLAAVPYGGEAEANAAITAAHEALEGWQAKTAQERGTLLRRLSDLMLARQEELALLMTREQGKPLAESRGEIAYAASFIDWAAEEGKRIYGETIPASHTNKRILVLKQPVGVAAVITPWNFPAAMITRKLGPALAAGCTVVIKPAEQTPLSALAIGALAVEAGIPASVVNIVTGDSRAIGGAFLSNPKVRKLSFTGSTEVGKILMGQATQNLTRLSLELGGHAPFLVFDDADVDAAVAGAMASKFRNMGQTCICANRFLVQDGIFEAFSQKLAAAAAALAIGPGDEEGHAIGPLIDDDAVEKVRSHIADATQKGAKILSGGHVVRPRPELSERFFQATVLADTTPDMLCHQDETFGPVAPLTRFRTEDEAIAMANDTPYGLAAYFYTRDASRLFRVAEGLEYGIIGANDGGPSTAQAPFGGMKQSGVGREGGKYVMNEYLETKYVSIGVNSP